MIKPPSENEDELDSNAEMSESDGQEMSAEEEVEGNNTMLNKYIFGA